MKFNQYTAKKCQCHRGLAEQSIKQNSDIQSNMLCLNIELSQNTYIRLRKKAFIWCIEVFTVAQYGDQMCIMNVHNHE